MDEQSWIQIHQRMNYLCQMQSRPGGFVERQGIDRDEGGLGYASETTKAYRLEKESASHEKKTRHKVIDARNRAIVVNGALRGSPDKIFPLQNQPNKEKRAGNGQ